MVAGDVKQISIDHDEQGGIVLEHKSTEDASIKKGGYENADDDSNITSTFNKIYIKNVKLIGGSSVYIVNGEVYYPESIDVNLDRLPEEYRGFFKFNAFER